jgi:hypothetical protein
MKKTIPLLLFLVLSATQLAGRSEPSSHAARQASSTADITTVVTALGPNFSAPPPITKQDVAVYITNDRQTVKSWEPAKGDNAGLQFAILIDDDDSPEAIGQHFSEIRDFINSQPSTTQVGLFYAMSGAAQTAAEFSIDHGAVARKLRLPLGQFAGESPSVYLSLQDLIKHWPTNNLRHEILMIASGVDRLHPDLQSPYVDEAVDSVLKAGVVVHTIYTGGFRLARTPFFQDIAWKNLIQVSGDAGGQQFFQGFETPVDFAPIFRQLETVLNNQYLLTFTTPRSSKKKGELRPLEIRVEQHNVKLSHASQVFVLGP